MKKYNNIIIDLDGTILDDKYRQYNCYKDILMTHDSLPRTIDEFWNMKRKKMSWHDILKDTIYQNNEKLFLEEWTVKIESNDYLRYSVLKRDAKVVLAYFNKISDCTILATSRRNKNTFFHQIASLEIRDFFQTISVCSEEKASRNLFSKLGGKTLVIGDTEEDESLARKYGFEFVAVLSGLREKKMLKGDYYINELVEIKNMM